MPLAEHDKAQARADAAYDVSIHVPLAEHDHLSLGVGLLTLVSIHVPLAEHDKGGLSKLGMVTADGRVSRPSGSHFLAT